MTGIRVEDLDSTRHRFLTDRRPPAIEDQHNIYPREILVFGQNLDQPIPCRRSPLVVQCPEVRPSENNAVAVDDKELRTHAIRAYAVNDKRASPQEPPEDPNEEQDEKSEIAGVQELQNETANLFFSYGLQIS